MFKNKYTNALRTTKNKYYAQMFMNVKGNSNGTWKIINNLINKGKSNVNEKPEFKDDNGIIIDEEEIAQKFNEYFVNICKHIHCCT